MTLAALDLATGETRSGRLADCPSAGQTVDWAKWATEPLRFVYVNLNLNLICSASIASERDVAAASSRALRSSLSYCSRADCRRYDDFDLMR